MISICMIVKDEEEIIEEAIKSTVGLADEIVILDTGSTDGTLPLLHKLGARVILGGDRMHKGESRNRAADAASGEWIVILDADEQIADPLGLREFLERTDAQAVYVRLAYMDADDQLTLVYPQMRCWQKGAYRYRYRAHEVPIPVNGRGKVETTEFIWEHRPPGGRNWKSQYTLDRLLLDVKEHPDNPRPLYYLGRQYMYRGEWEKSIEALRQYLDTPERHDLADVFFCLSTCYGRMGEEDKKIEALHRACAVEPRRREFWGNLATVYYYDKRDFEIAAALLKCALELEAPTGTYVNHFWRGYHIYDMLARCLWKLERYQEGRSYAFKAVELNTASERLRDNLAFFEERCGAN